MELTGWGNFPKIKSRVASPLGSNEVSKIISGESQRPLIARGLGRSYGDSSLASNVISTLYLDHMIRFDESSGVLTCSAGVSLADILSVFVPRGWFLPVTPGTQFVTVGGAIANDVHGKNHHMAGTFGQHVHCFELVRSDGSRHICSKNENIELFQATIGGLGLTGVITWAEFQLISIKNALIKQEIIRYSNLNEFFDLARDSDQNFEHTVSWIDCLATGKQLGRGIFIRGNHADPRYCRDAGHNAGADY